MSIEAHNKILNEIINSLNNYKSISKRNITNNKEAYSIIQKAFAHNVYSYKIIDSIQYISYINTTETVYENGLTYLHNEITYKDNTIGNEIYNIQQHIITSEQESTPLVNLFIKIENKSIQQLLTKSSPNDEFIPETEKNIKIIETIPYIKTTCGSNFKSYIDKNNNSLLIEKYLQSNPISKNKNYGLIYLCGNLEHEVEIIYHQNKPIYANFEDSDINSIVGYNPNSKSGAQFVVNKINTEICAITQEINYILNKYGKTKTKIIKK